MDYLVSVIVPVFNVEQYLSKCIDSILQQSYKNIEVIIVDDGSTDSSSEICDEYKRKDTRVKVIHKTNGGLSSTRNKGLDLCNGSYVMFIDSDDYIEKNMVKDLVMAAIKQDADIVQCGFQTIYEDGSIKRKYNYENLVIKHKDNILDEYFNQNLINVIVCNKLYKSKLFENIRMIEGRNQEDYMLMPELLSKVDKFVNINGIYYNYLQRYNSIMNSTFSEKKLDAIYAGEHVINFCNQKIPKYKNKAIILMCKNCIYLYFDLMKSNSNNKEHKKIIEDKFITYYSIIDKTKELDNCPNRDKILIKLFDFNRNISYKLYTIYQNIKDMRK